MVIQVFVSFVVASVAICWFSHSPVRFQLIIGFFTLTGVADLPRYSGISFLIFLR